MFSENLWKKYFYSKFSIRFVWKNLTPIGKKKFSYRKLFSSITHWIMLQTTCNFWSVLPVTVPQFPPSFRSNECELQKFIFALPMGSPPHGEPSPCPPHGCFSTTADAFGPKLLECSPSHYITFPTEFPLKWVRIAKVHFCPPHGEPSPWGALPMPSPWLFLNQTWFVSLETFGTHSPHICNLLKRVLSISGPSWSSSNKKYFFIRKALFQTLATPMRIVTERVTVFSL